MFSKKYFLVGTILGLILVVSFFYFLPDGKLHVIFCDVGQGDGIFIKTPSNQDFLIDGGPNDKILSCLGSHMPFYDRKIDVVMLTHPQKDHLQGLISVISRFQVDYIVLGDEANNTLGYQKLLDEIKTHKINVKRLYRGNVIKMGETDFEILWPEKNWVDKKLYQKNFLGFEDVVKEEGVNKTKKVDPALNDYSFYVLMRFGRFKSLFTGDGDVRIQPFILRNGGDLAKVNVLKVPHHGSKTSLLGEFLDMIKPDMAIISVGKNSYGHPSKILIDLLVNRLIPYLRTDEKGDIEIVSDGKSWQVVNR